MYVIDSSSITATTAWTWVANSSPLRARHSLHSPQGHLLSRPPFDPHSVLSQSLPQHTLRCTLCKWWCERMDSKMLAHSPRSCIHFIDSSGHACLLKLRSPRFLALFNFLKYSTLLSSVVDAVLLPFWCNFVYITWFYVTSGYYLKNMRKSHTRILKDTTPFHAYESKHNDNSIRCLAWLNFITILNIFK